MKKNKMIIRVATGRLGVSSYNLYKSMGFRNEEYENVCNQRKNGDDIRKYIFEGDNSILIEGKPTDLPAYVDSGSADITICGDDTKIEYELAGISALGAMTGRGYQSAPLLSRLNEEFKFSPTNFCVIGKEEFRKDYEASTSLQKDGIISPFPKPIVVGTEYPKLAKYYFSKKYPQGLFDYLTLAGKTETAIGYGGADVIFELVGTGATVKANKLSIFETALANPTKVIVNNASIRNNSEVEELYRRLT
jgi:ATP phosphoribosyltransferase